MDRIQAQFAKLWQLLTAAETTDTYSKTLSLTSSILKETATLLWLLVCLVLVAFDWFWNTAFQLGYAVRAWVNGLDSQGEQLVPNTGKSLLEVGKNSLISSINHAKEQLGVPVSLPPAPPEPRKIEAAKPIESPKTVTVAPPVAPSQEPKVGDEE
ncbi:MAG: hypothetical protein SFW36_19265 [Leptolyngbyaceae cyanobacterium bins.59]|nr:hypothetical protein [Leptolyngbyaceae cyanobacterium bins.59]